MELSLTDLFPFGKFKGQQVEDIIYDNPNYIIRLIEEEVVTFDQNAQELLEELKIV